jgi:hypothetical protein
MISPQGALSPQRGSKLSFITCAKTQTLAADTAIRAS